MLWSEIAAVSYTTCKWCVFVNNLTSDTPETKDKRHTALLRDWLRPEPSLSFSVIFQINNDPAGIVAR